MLNAKWIEPLQQDAVKEAPWQGFGPGAVKEQPGENTKRLRPAQYVRREFPVRRGLVKAQIRATAHGLYRLFVNGERASERLLTPDVTPFQKMLTLQVYDVTPLLREGLNAVGAVLTDGWHIGRIGLTGDSCQYANRLAFLCEIRLEYGDGTDVIGSDGSFVSSTGPIDWSDIYIGERYDARKEMPGWSVPGFDDGGWSNVREASYPEAVKETSRAPILKHEHFEGVKRITPSGQEVYDIGQVIAGVERVTLRGKRGACLAIRHSEVLDRSGNFFSNIVGRNKDQTDVYVCSGSGAESYEPVGTFHGFRYVCLEYDPGEIEVERVEAWAVRTQIRETASFECSDERFNRLWSNVVWSLRGNTVSIPTDCPQRERSGFTGDMQIFIRTACMLTDFRNFAENWLECVRLDQADDGEVPVIAPNFPGLENMQRKGGRTNTSSGWGDAIAIVPWELYMSCGDVTVLRDNYEAMKKWLAFVERWARTGVPGSDGTQPSREGHARYLWDTGFHFGDWLAPSVTKQAGTPFAAAEQTKGPMGTAYYANSADIVSRAADLLGKPDEAAYYRALAKNIRDAFEKEYYRGKGELTVKLQGVYVIAIAFRMLPEPELDKCAAVLNDMIAQNGYRLDTGFLSVAHLMDAVYGRGFRETAKKLLFQDRAPSWLYEVKNGATTVWESWDAIREDGEVTGSSFNHYSFGCVASWIMERVVGIENLRPGWTKVRIEPFFDCGLAYAQGSVETAGGRIFVRWEIREDAKGRQVFIQTEIPAGIDAELCAGGRTYPLPAGTRERTLSL